MKTHLPKVFLVLRRGGGAGRRQMKQLSYLMVLVLILALTSCTESPTVPKDTPTDVGVLTSFTGPVPVTPGTDPTPGTECIAPPSGLVSWWPGDGNANDIAGPHDGTLQGEATFAPGLVSEAFSFDGDGDLVSLPATSDWNFGTGDFTVDFWGKSSTNGTKRMHAFSFEPNYGVSNLDFNFDDPDLFGIPVGLWVYWNSIGINRITVGSAGDYTDGQWHHVALTRNSTTMTLYVDGSSVGTTTYSPAIDLSSSNIHYIGAGQLGGPSPAVHWDGLIDEVQIVNRALSADEILAIFNAGSAGKCKSTANTPPTADAGPDQTVEWTSGGVSVTLDGTGSGDPDGDALTFSWTDPNNVVVGTGPTPTINLGSLSSHTITLTVNDGQATDTDDVVINVVDTTAPHITVALVPVPEPDDDDEDDEDEVDMDDDEGHFRVEFTCSDLCDANPTITSAMLNGIAVTNGQIVKLELEDDDGQEVEFDDGILEIEASSFELTVTCVDASGNVATATAVPQW